MAAVLAIELFIRDSLQSYCGGKCGSLDAELSPALPAVHALLEVILGEQFQVASRSCHGSVVKRVVGFFRGVVLYEYLQYIILAVVMLVSYIYLYIQAVDGIGAYVVCLTIV